MDYENIYNNLIIRAQNRILDAEQYYEKHHIIPKCLGGNDVDTNLIRLTGREHFVAHQLLCKIYPKNGRLIKAATMMCSSSNIMNRSQNRLYEWLRIKLAEEFSKSQSGAGNSQFGKIWIYSLIEKQAKKIDPKNFEKYRLAGWKKGRKIRFENLKRICFCCKKEYDLKINERYCSDFCKTIARKRRGVFYGREKEFLKYYEQKGNLHRACKEMGFPGAVGAYYRIGKKIIEEHLRP